MDKLKIILPIICILIASCANNSKNQKSEQKLRSPLEIYKSASAFFESNNYELAINEYNKLIKLYPLSNEAIESETMIGFIYYVLMEYDEAIKSFELIMKKYPAHKNLDYIYYMRAMCNYEQIAHHALDGKYTDMALQNFNQVILRFPKSNYSKDSRQKIILVKSNQAAKHMEIGRFYLKQKKHTAALNRFKIVIDEFSETKFTPEALHRMVETYYQMGMLEESYKTASVLGYNYPDSKWYKYSYNLIKKEDDDTETILNKIKSFF